MITCLVSKIECLCYSEHNGIGYLLASTAEHKTVESEEQRRQRRKGEGVKERRGRGGEGERGGRWRWKRDLITGVLSMCTTCNISFQGLTI